MAGKGLIMIEDQIKADYGFSVTVGNIIESSSASLRSSLPEKQFSSDTLPEMTINVKRENPGQSSRTIRKKISRQTRTVKTTNLSDDGYGWRKYGQKIINNQPYPKSYYRCTHHKEEKCEAKKWIQQESENPPIYKTTYLGQHTCKNPHKFPQIFFSDYSTLSSPTSSDDNLESFDCNYSSVPQPFLLRFNSPESNNHVVSNVNKQITDTSALIRTVDSTAFPADEAPQIDTWPSIPSPSCSFGSYDFDMAIQDYFLDLDNVNLMEEY